MITTDNAAKMAIEPQHPLASIIAFKFPEQKRHLK